MSFCYRVFEHAIKIKTEIELQNISTSMFLALVLFFYFIYLQFIKHLHWLLWHLWQYLVPLYCWARCG